MGEEAFVIGVTRLVYPEVVQGIHLYKAPTVVVRLAQIVIEIVRIASLYDVYSFIDELSFGQ